MGCGASTQPTEDIPSNEQKLAQAANATEVTEKTTEQTGKPRLVLYASDTPDKADFVGGPFESIALACHGDGPSSGFAWKISTHVFVTEPSALGDGVTSVLTALGKATVEGGRVDLFACSLLATPEGKLTFESIQRATATHFAASDDLTGNARGAEALNEGGGGRGRGGGTRGQDWIMESDGVNVKPLYFADTSEFEGNFGYRSSGTVKKWIEDKGGSKGGGTFGFIAPDDGSDEIYVNVRGVVGCE